MKTVTPRQLALAYNELNPGEIVTAPLRQSDGTYKSLDISNPTVMADAERTFGNWLARYEKDPSKTLATQNWAGKVTTALFRALGIKQPRTKRSMLIALDIH